MRTGVWEKKRTRRYLIFPSYNWYNKEFPMRHFVNMQIARLKAGISGEALL
jgi:hypothetical protein